MTSLLSGKKKSKLKDNMYVNIKIKININICMHLNEEGELYIRIYTMVSSLPTSGNSE